MADEPDLTGMAEEIRTPQPDQGAAGNGAMSGPQRFNWAEGDPAILPGEKYPQRIRWVKGHVVPPGILSRMPLCGYFAEPTAAERARLPGMPPGTVLGCGDEQGEGPLFFFVPVHGGAVRVGVCRRHADLLAKYHGAKDSSEET